MEVFYRGPCALVTEDVFQVRCPGLRSFAIHEFADVYVIQGQDSTVANHSGSIRYCATGLAGAAALAALTGWPMFDAPGLSLAALIVLGLFETEDGRTFGQVSRALQRAMEYQQDKE
jgi:hypothetical protein